MVNDENSCAKAASKAAAKPKGLRALAPATEEEKHPATARHKAEAGSPQFFSAAAVGASPTLMTKKAHEEAFDLMPSPTATVLPSGGRREEVELAPAKRFEFKAVVSPTINTKKAEAEAFDLMPSPTATVAVPSGAARLEFRAQKPADVPAAAAGGFMVREDTSMGGFIAPQKSADVPAAAGGGFMVREDTAMGGFIAPDEAPLASGAGGFEIREDTDMRGNGAVGGGGGGRGLQLRPEGDQPCASSGFMVREDTNLKGACFTEAPPACEDAAGSLGACRPGVAALLCCVRANRWQLLCMQAKSYARSNSRAHSRDRGQETGAQAAHARKCCAAPDRFDSRRQEALWCVKTLASKESTSKHM
jgi:hypothetical protein